MSARSIALLAMLLPNSLAACARVNAQEETTLMIIASSEGYSEFLILRKSDDQINWQFIDPGDTYDLKPREHTGTVAGDNVDLKKVFEKMVSMEKMRNTEDQAVVLPYPQKVQGFEPENPESRDKVEDPVWVKFTMLLTTVDGSRATYPLSVEQRRFLIDRSELKEVLLDVKSKYFLGRINNMLEFWYVYPDMLRATGTIKGTKPEE